MTKEDIATIERIVRQSSYNTNNPDEHKFGSWLSVDQDQVLELLEHIPDRLPCGPLVSPFADYHLCAVPDCPVSIAPDRTFCWTHEVTHGR